MLKEISESFPDLMKDMNINIQEGSIPSKVHSKGLMQDIIKL